MKPRWRRRRAIVSMCACLCERVWVRDGRCVREALIPSGSRHKESAHESARESARARASELITWMKLPKLSLSHQVAFQEHQLRASRTHTCHLSCSFARTRRASSDERPTTNDECRTPHELPTALSRGGSPSVRIHINNAVRRTSWIIRSTTFDEQQYQQKQQQQLQRLSALKYSC